MYKNERSIMCQFRSGVLPLRIETGRFIGEALNQRLCWLCNTDAVEDEFLFECALYNNLRTTHSADIFNHDNIMSRAAIPNNGTYSRVGSNK